MCGVGTTPSLYFIILNNLPLPPGRKYPHPQEAEGRGVVFRKDQEAPVSPHLTREAGPRQELAWPLFKLPLDSELV